MIPEFVNPKYADEARNKFKAPTRLECMMQDYPKLLSAKGCVGFTTYDTWFSFSPVKNNVKDAAGLAAKGMPTFGAASGEYDFYNWTQRVLKEVAGVHIEEQTEAHEYAGIKIAYGPKILLDPTFAITLADIRAKFQGTNHISKNSTLILKGHNANVKDLKLDGVLKIESGQTASGEVSNKERIDFVAATESDNEIFRIRGFKPAHVK